ncbi:MAG: Crp/Fnr family transcriptional regulator [Actinomycetota bacterium]
MADSYLYLKQVRLFAGLDESYFPEIVACLNAKVKAYPKGSILLLMGENVKNIGIVLSGNVEISRQDYSGNRLIINLLEYPDMFGEAFVCAGVKTSPVTLTALTDVTIMLIDFKRIIDDSSNICKFHSVLISNMIRMLADKNLVLNNRLELISKKTTRAKLTSYLLHTMGAELKSNVSIPYNRNQLAEYLGVNRSAMSKELCAMRAEGILDFRKNNFEILNLKTLSTLASG